MLVIGIIADNWMNMVNEILVGNVSIVFNAMIAIIRMVVVIVMMVVSG